jgi:hypothetical protein
MKPLETITPYTPAFPVIAMFTRSKTRTTSLPLYLSHPPGGGRNRDISSKAANTPSPADAGEIYSMKDSHPSSRPKLRVEIPEKRKSFCVYSVLISSLPIHPSSADRYYGSELSLFVIQRGHHVTPASPDSVFTSPMSTYQRTASDRPRRPSDATPSFESDLD